VVGSVFTIAPETIRFLMSSRVALIKVKKQKKAVQRKKLNPKLAIEVKGCPQSKNFRTQRKYYLTLSSS
jgi:hypothetical protein